MAQNSFVRKFTVAISGIVWAVRTQNSFWIHGAVTVAIVALAAWLRCQPWRWVAIVLCVALVWTAEMLNTSIECMVRKLHPDHDDQIRRCLDVAAGAVLIASVASVVVGSVVLGPPLLTRIMGDDMMLGE